MNTLSLRHQRLAVLLIVALLYAALPIQAQDSPTTLPGTLAIVGPDQNIYLLHNLETGPQALTEDAEQGTRSYAWPTWSTDGRLAFFAQEFTRENNERRSLLRIFIQEPEADTFQQAYASDIETLTYAYWAPANCPQSAACRDLAVLVSTRQGLGVIRVRDEAPDFRVESIGLGQPFYFSFSPDASQMLWTRFSSQIEVYDTAANEITEILPDSAGIYQAPMWSPVDNRLLFSIIDEGQHNLVIASNGDRQVIAENQRGSLWFAWSPEGAHVAYKLDLGALTVVDSSSGETVALSSQDPVVAFFWAPDGQKIAYLTLPGRDDPSQVIQGRSTGRAAPARQNGLPAFTWNILDITTGERWTSYAGFLPTRDMLYLVAYFDQFVQSHQVWSPDSRYVTYAALDPATGDSQIMLLDTTDPASDARHIADGSIAIWSYRE